MGRFFRSLDERGWHEFFYGMSILTVAGVLSYAVARFVHLIPAAILCFIGFDVAFRMFDHSMLGSIFRNRDGKNKDLYLSRRAYLDERFKAVYGVDTRDGRTDDSFTKVLLASVKLDPALTHIKRVAGRRYRMTRDDITRIRSKYRKGGD